MNLQMSFHCGLQLQAAIKGHEMSILQILTATEILVFAHYFAFTYFGDPLARFRPYRLDERLICFHY